MELMLMMMMMMLVRSCEDGNLLTPRTLGPVCLSSDPHIPSAARSCIDPNSTHIIPATVYGEREQKAPCSPTNPILHNRTVCLILLLFTLIRGNAERTTDELDLFCFRSSPGCIWPARTAHASLLRCAKCKNRLPFFKSSFGLGTFFCCSLHFIFHALLMMILFFFFFWQCVFASFSHCSSLVRFVAVELLALEDKTKRKNWHEHSKSKKGRSRWSPN